MPTCALTCREGSECTQDTCCGDRVNWNAQRGNRPPLLDNKNNSSSQQVALPIMDCNLSPEGDEIVLEMTGIPQTNSSHKLGI